MADRKQKYAALNEAIKTAREFARGGSDKLTPGFVLEETYNLIVKLTDQIDQETSGNQPPA